MLGGEVVAEAKKVEELAAARVDGYTCARVMRSFVGCNRRCDMRSHLVG